MSRLLENDRNTFAASEHLTRPTEKYPSPLRRTQTTDCRWIYAISHDQGDYIETSLTALL